MSMAPRPRDTRFVLGEPRHLGAASQPYPDLRRALLQQPFHLGLQDDENVRMPRRHIGYVEPEGGEGARPASAVRARETGRGGPADRASPSCGCADHRPAIPFEAPGDARARAHRPRRAAARTRASAPSAPPQRSLPACRSWSTPLVIVQSNWSTRTSGGRVRRSPPDVSPAAPHPRHPVPGPAPRPGRTQPATSAVSTFQRCGLTAQGRSLPGLRTPQTCLIRSPAISNAYTVTVTPSRCATRPG
jgi:hypothetical protein